MGAYRNDLELASGVPATAAQAAVIRNDPVATLKLLYKYVGVEEDNPLALFQYLEIPAWCYELFMWLLKYLPDAELATMPGDFLGAIQMDSDVDALLPRIVAWLINDCSKRKGEDPNDNDYYWAKVWDDVDGGRATLSSGGWRPGQDYWGHRFLHFLLTHYLNPTGATPLDPTTTPPTRAQVDANVVRAAVAIYGMLSGQRFEFSQKPPPEDPRGGGR